MRRYWTYVLLVGLVAVPARMVAAQPAPIGLWTLDESPASSGTVLADSSGNANTGTLVTDNGSTNKSVPGRIGQAIALDGVGDYIDIANQANFNFDRQTFTVAAWLKDTPPAGGMVVSKGGGAGGWFLVVDNVSLEVVFKTGTGANAFFYDVNYPTLGDGNWHHVAIVLTFDTVTSANNAALVYVDGVLQNGIPTHNSVPVLSSATVKFGVRSDAATPVYYAGKIDDARIYNTALTATQVQALFSATPAPPTVTTSAATGVTASAAVLNGSVNPNGLATNAWFEWGTSPTLATFTATATQALGAGTTAQAVTANLSGLSVGTTYYYRTAASSSAGTSKGAIVSFNTSGSTGPIGLWTLDESPASSGTILADSSGNANTGTLVTDNGSTNKSVPGRIGQAIALDGVGDYIDIANQANFNFDRQTFTVAAWLKDTPPAGGMVVSKGGGTAGGWFLVVDNVSLEVVFKTGTGANAFFYDVNYPTLGDGNWHHVAIVLTFDTVTSANNAALVYLDGVLQNGIPTNNSVPALSSATVKFGVRSNASTPVYYAGKIDDARIYNTALTATQVQALFSATPAPPTVTTSAATGVTASAAVLNGSVNPNGLATNAWFEWGTSPTLATFTATATQALGAGTTAQAVTTSLPGLSAGTTYYYRTAASSSAGTSKGAIVSFITTGGGGGQVPTVTTTSATGVTASGAVLNGSANPNGLATNAWFEWGTSPTLATFTTTATQALGAGTTAQPVTAGISALISGTTYYYRTAASNSAGTSKGAIVSFNTLIPPPTVTTMAATGITASGAALNGSVNPNGLATNAWFEWGTSPTLATFTATATQALGAGTTAQAVTANLSGLSVGTTYYYRVAASSSAGTSKGAIVSFNTSVSTGLIGLWTLDENPASSGTVLADSSGSANTGTLVTNNGSTNKSVPGRIGQAIALDGVGDYIDIANQANFNFNRQIFTVAAWLKDTPPAGGMVVSKGGGTAGGWFLVVDNVSLEVVFKTGTGANAFFYDVDYPTLGDGNWHHVAIVLTFDTVTSANNAALVYVDGALQNGTPTHNSAPALSNATVKFGVRSEAGTPVYYAGKIDDARIYNTALSAAQIQVLAGNPIYVAVGDSITRGSHDNVPTDGIGYEPILSELLTASKGFPVSVANVGVSGTTSADGAASIFATLAAYPGASHYLILYGSNDAFIPAVPSGRGLNPGDTGYNGSYKDYMQQIITAIVSAGKTPYLAKVPFANFSGISDSAIQDYNAVIDELVGVNGIQVVPPDFYTYFKAHQNELDDGLHPNETGYQSMANMWFTVLQSIN